MSEFFQHFIAEGGLAVGVNITFFPYWVTSIKSTNRLSRSLAGAHKCLDRLLSYIPVTWSRFVAVKKLLRHYTIDQSSSRSIEEKTLTLLLRLVEEAVRPSGWSSAEIRITRARSPKPQCILHEPGMVWWFGLIYAQRIEKAGAASKNWMIIENYEISSRNVLLRTLGGALRVRFLISGGGTLYLGEDGNVASFLLLLRLRWLVSILLISIYWDGMISSSLIDLMCEDSYFSYFLCDSYSWRKTIRICVHNALSIWVMYGIPESYLDE